jgi:DHA1 family multidrug resistance protein-like MFS transporter
MSPLSILCLLNFLIHLGYSMISPILPIYARSFGVSVTEVGFIMTSYALARTFIDLPAGYFTHHYGVVRTLSVALTVTAISSAMLGIVSSFWPLVFWRFWQGVGSALFITPGLVAVAALSPHERLARNIALYQGFHHLGSSFGPTLGGFLADHMGYRVPFFLFASLAALAMVIISLRLKSSPNLHHQLMVDQGTLEGISWRKNLRLWFRNALDRKWKTAKGVSSPTLDGVGDRQEADQSTLRMMAHIFMNRQFLLIAMVEFIIFFTRSGSQYTIVPLLGANNLGLKVSQIGFTLTLVALGHLSTIYLAGWLGDRFGVKKVLVPSILLASVSIFLFGMSGNYISYLSAGIIFGVGTGCGGSLPPAYAAQIRGDMGYGLIVGPLRLFGDVGLMVGPIILGLVADAASYRQALVMNASLMFGIIILFGLLAAKPTVVRPNNVPTLNVKSS